MSKTDCAINVFSSASLHLDVVDEFIAIAQSKLDGATSDFTRDSLTDLLAGLTEQRETYRAVLAAAPTANALAA
ncbi:hypothetical protein SAMN02982917_2086 [Azospirillum oryzae]|uniref:Uncharacterized protein n=1 Tax=Azospirillum oryzae TaxID=286727 RepID=A0A1X7EX40_9PROT|nr:hypothetical protein [Azospirillum oryzae]SMF41939.1 hypothetical protein SAMN02982917_2086 [Azospirillum oryzae]